jgi:4a-hydroxytetrahydrobiopterin dehydratase
MSDANTLLSGDEIRAMDGMADWRSMYDALEARYRTGDFTTGLELVNRIGAAAEAAGHHPDIQLSYATVHVLLTSHDVGGKTRRDVDLARQISTIAADLGVNAEPGTLQRIELALDTWDRAQVQPFWAAVLGMRANDDEVVDDDGDTPTIWFQDADRETSQRWHVDIRVPPEVADERVAAALDAGGTLVADDQKPRFVVLADPQGNRVCVCTHVTRSH